ncbi:hypothetical protein FQA39_LY10044 [Lamprigera yunnana]|nr:hypothetical protein FQA39_LY10044 [Lamprigera yunnana]
MDRWVGKLAVITGASSGIGAAAVDEFLDHGINVIGLARRKQNLLEMAEKFANKKGRFYGFKADVTNETEILEVFKWIDEYVGPVHILVNNAGLIKVGTSLINGNVQTWRDIFETNVLGLCLVTREAIRCMEKYSIAGQIIHMNSIFGHKVGKLPFTNVYPASKHAVTALTETLRRDLISRRLPIKVTNLSPGLVQTEMLDSNHTELVKKIPLSIATEVNKSLQALPVLTTGEVVDAIMYILSTPVRVQVHELILKPLYEME